MYQMQVGYNADAIAANWRLWTRNVVNLVTSQFITLSVHLIFSSTFATTADACNAIPASDERNFYISIVFSIAVLR